VVNHITKTTNSEQQSTRQQFPGWTNQFAIVLKKINFSFCSSTEMFAKFKLCAMDIFLGNKSYKILFLSQLFRPYTCCIFGTFLASLLRMYGC